MEAGFDAKFIYLVFMEKTRKIIQNNFDKFPEFNYYLNIITKVEENIEEMPDTSIECCKALFDGISKTILDKFNISYVENTDTSSSLLKKVFKQINNEDDISKEFIQISHIFIVRVNELRNERGDISHGKAVPKENNSDKYLAGAMVGISDNIISYMLSRYFEYDLSELEEIKYENNINFNEYLDSEFYIERVIYSKALFNQDIVAYKEGLNNYNSS